MFKLDNQLLLKKDFPNLYAALLNKSKEFKNLSISEFGIQCGNGWFKVIYLLSSKLEPLITNLPDKDLYYAIQLTEDSGSLKFKLSNYTEEIKKTVNFYEKFSIGVCEICGEEGYLLNSDGIKISRCKDH